MKKLPDSPGVYFFLGGKKEILYIGKATSLKDRVKSYFSRDLHEARGPVIVKMVDEAVDVDYRETDSVLEALILEASLIKTHAPKYNAREKDDKSYNYLVITKEDYPRVLVVRGKDLDQTFKPKDVKYLFGPFPQGGLFKEAMKIVRRIFPFGDTCTPFDPDNTKKARPCFNAQIGLCPGVCSGAISKVEYARTINHIRLFFEGKKGQLRKQLEREMGMYAKKQEFEKAQRVKKQLFAIDHINDVTLLKREVRDLPRAGRVFRIEAYDIAHVSGRDMVGVMVVVEDGEIKKADYRKFRVKSVEGVNDIAALEEVLRRRFKHDDWRLPNMIVLDGGKAQLNAGARVLNEFGYQISILSVVKNERHQAREILGDKDLRKEHESAIVLANHEAHRFAVGYHRNLRKIPR